MTDRLAKLEKLLAADPNDGFVLYAIAQEHGKAGEHGRAIEFYDRLMVADPKQCYAYFFKAKSLDALGRLPEAIGVVEAGLRVAQRTGDAKALNELSGLKMDLELK